MIHYLCCHFSEKLVDSLVRPIFVGDHKKNLVKTRFELLHSLCIILLQLAEEERVQALPDVPEILQLGRVYCLLDRLENLFRTITFGLVVPALVLEGLEAAREASVGKKFLDQHFYVLHVSHLQ